MDRSSSKEMIRSGLPSVYAMTSNVRYDENMSYDVHHSERGSAISDCLVSQFHSILFGLVLCRSLILYDESILLTQNV